MECYTFSGEKKPKGAEKYIDDTIKLIDAILADSEIVWAPDHPNLLDEPMTTTGKDGKDGESRS